MPTSDQPTTPTVEVPEELRDQVWTTFIDSCVFGCLIRVVDTVQKPHVCVGEQVIAALVPEAPFDAVKGIADGLQPLLRERLGHSWEDGVRSGREGLCAGVDDDVPEGHLPLAPLFAAQGAER